MAAKIVFNVTGISQLYGMLAALGVAGNRGPMNAALRKGAQVILKGERMLVPQPGNSKGFATGQSKRALGIRTLKKKDFAKVGVVVGSMRPRGRIAHLLEFGTRHSAAQPFRGPSARQLAESAFDAIRKELIVQVQKAAQKATIRAGGRIP